MSRHEFDDAVEHAFATRDGAVAGSTAALFGGYDRWDRLAIVRLGAGRVHLDGDFQLVLPHGEGIPATARIVGRGRELRVVTVGAWYGYQVSGSASSP
ncbi:hypothetical protein [Kibdelosporangium phytohabitans]|uniref:Uncharacterized protein n=1 Tax=Kibdelosporangium phytohabitans TaxID=860235 RepID=A0A0N9HVC9_9PSEU|nr:hypothetical protein [Kibdelosporangium phytohabitans]ALG11274.1 hypothetical protein AOZ06_34275 [Kibdelosporangium phytohabitans]MBE1462564.1 hypothetical protein [Kibdelosporangium phytohabitans]